MTHLAVVLVLTAALFHASWNFLAKRTGKSPGFVWLNSTVSAILYLPALALFLLLTKTQIQGMQALFILISACLQAGYCIFLQRSYGTGDLSLSYPLARGTGPLFSTLGAIVLLGERPSLGALIGIVALIGGVMFLMGNPWQLLRQGTDARAAIGYALLTGLFIATYTLIDKYAVGVLLISPLLMDGASTIARSGLLIPSVIGKWDGVCTTWRTYRLEVLGVAILGPLAYLLVLSALTFSPVSQVAPMRECSVLIGAFLGTRLLAEKHARRRLISAGVILVGVFLLAIS